MLTKQFLHALDDDKIAEAIGEAEKRTSGEIRVYVSDEIEGDPVLSAEREFVRLGMHHTELRNGVLIFFAPKSQNYAVLGDKAIHEKCGADFWKHIVEEMTPLLKVGKFTEAIVLAVREIGETLSKHFPVQPGDRNELPNKVERPGPR